MPGLSEDIRITGIDIPKGQALPGQPRVQRIYLRLSGRPSVAWQTIFLQVRGVTRPPLVPDARIEGPLLLLDCVPEELEQHPLESLQEEVKKTKTQFRVLLTQRHAEARRPLPADQAAQTGFHAFQNRLTFAAWQP
jgi:hypothetical protein